MAELPQTTMSSPDRCGGRNLGPLTAVKREAALSCVKRTSSHEGNDRRTHLSKTIWVRQCRGRASMEKKGKSRMWPDMAACLYLEYCGVGIRQDGGKNRM
jgi:hypothetical protein